MATILVEILGEAKQFKHELNSAVASTEKANSGFSKLGKAAGVAGLAIAGGVALGLEKSFEAAQKAQEETGKLNKAFENAGMSAKGMAGWVAKLEDSQRRLGFTNNDTRGSLTKLITAGDSAAQANRDLAVASDLARFKNESLADATTQLIKVHAGNARALKEVGIVMPPITAAVDALKAAHVDASTAAGKHALALAAVQDKLATGAAAADILSGKVKGQAEEFSKSSEGGMAQFHAQLGNLEEKIGSGLIPVFTALITGVNKAIVWISTNWPKISAAISPVLDAVKRDIQILVDDGEALWKKFGGTIMKVIDDVKNVLRDDLNIIKDIFSIFGDLLSGNWSKLWQDVKQLASDGLSQVKDLAKLGLDGLKLVFTAAWTAIKSSTSGLVDSVLAFFKSLPGQIIGALGDVSHLLYNAGASILQGLIDGMTSKLGAVKSLAGSIAGDIAGLKGPIEYDRVLLVPHGQAIIQGLQAGMESGLGALRTMTSGIAPSLSANVAGSSLSAPTGGGSGGGDIYVTVNGWVGNDQDIAEKIRNMLIRTGRNTSGGALGGFA